jgi:hypothetical protein
MLQFRRNIEFLATTAALVFGTFGAIALTTKLFGDRCWPPRFGGLLVGCAVFAQGYVYANQEFFSKPSNYGLTREQRVLHQVYVVTVFGTLLWTLGDFIPSIYGVATCRAR